MPQPITPRNNPRFGIEHIIAIVFGLTGLTTALYAIWQNRKRVYDTALHWRAEGTFDTRLAFNPNDSH